MLDLRDVISVPGARLPFERELDPGRLAAPYVVAFEAAPRGAGEVVNTAGALWVRAGVDADMLCRCDRCGRTYSRHKHVDVAVPVVDAEDSEEAEAFCLQGEELDIDDLLETAFILDMESKSLCRPDCKGLCPKCGKDLNDGPCGYRPDIDPRLAVLEQLLDK